MNTCIVGTIALTPVGNEQGGFYFINLNTGMRLVCYKWTKLPVPKEVIKRVNQLRKLAKTTQDLIFQFSDGEEVGDNSDNESYVPSNDGADMDDDKPSKGSDGNDDDDASSSRDDNDIDMGEIPGVEDGVDDEKGLNDQDNITADADELDNEEGNEGSKTTTIATDMSSQQADDRDVIRSKEEYMEKR